MFMKTYITLYKNQAGKEFFCVNFNLSDHSKFIYHHKEPRYSIERVFIEVSGNHVDAIDSIINELHRGLPFDKAIPKLEDIMTL